MTASIINSVGIIVLAGHSYWLGTRVARQERTLLTHLAWHDLVDPSRRRSSAP